MRNYSKYGNKKVEFDWIKFDSIKEKNRFCDLKILEKAGKISSLVLQPSYVLQEKFKDNLGKAIRSIKYNADFSYKDNNTWMFVAEDVKWSKKILTEAFKIKFKLAKFKYPNIIFKIVY